MSNLSGAATVAAGVDHSIAATGAAAVWDWGNNQYGQLGNGSTSESDVPVQPTGLGSVDTQTTATYTYDGTGLRATKTVNGTTSHFAYDLSSGTPLILTDGTTDYVYGPGGLPIEQVTGSGSPIYLSQDQLGSTRLLTNSSGAVVGTYSYDPAGNITSETGTATTNLLFAGQYLDQESGLYWMRARYYDPTTSQFLSVDPLNTGATSPYSYAADNPVNAIDPSGSFCLEFWSPSQCVNAFTRFVQNSRVVSTAWNITGGQVIHNIQNFASSSHTLGVCSSVSGNLFVGGGTADICGVVRFHGVTPVGLATTETLGLGAGPGLGITGLLEAQGSNAPNLQSLGGPFAYFAGSGGGGPAVGGSLAEGLGSCGPLSVGSVGIGLGLGGGAQVGVNYTWEQTLFGS